MRIFGAVELVHVAQKHTYTFITCCTPTFGGRHFMYNNYTEFIPYKGLVTNYREGGGGVLQNWRETMKREVGGGAETVLAVLKGGGP